MSMAVALTGQRRLTMLMAAKELKVAYKTVRDYVLVREEVPFVRKGKPRKAGGPAYGCKVLIDEHGLAKLRELLPSDEDVPVSPESPQFASTDSQRGRPGSP